jgi:spore maturation protein CgeB
MAELGWCPSGRLFEAAACGTPLITDCWEGLDTFFTPGEDILCAQSGEAVLAALAWGDSALQTMARRARERTLDENTSLHRARTLVGLLHDSVRPACPDRQPLEAR